MVWLLTFVLMPILRSESLVDVLAWELAVSNNFKVSKIIEISDFLDLSILFVFLVKSCR